MECRSACGRSVGSTPCPEPTGTGRLRAKVFRSQNWDNQHINITCVISTAMLNVPSACILGLVALIAAGGCGSGSGRPTVPPPDASSARGPSLIEPGAGPPAPVMEAKEGPRPVPELRRPFDAPLRAPAVATGDPELDPLVAYLKASFSAAIRDGRRLVIDDMTDVEQLHFREPYQHL